MNERIKELMNQSGMISESSIPGGVWTNMSVKTAEKFAELIVRECAQVCRGQPNHYALKADRDNCAIAIEEHFGVEE